MGRTARLGPFAQPGRADRDAHWRDGQLGIGDLAASDYSRLPGGQRQLVLIARALAQDTPLIVMDEPTASLDFGNQAQVLARIARLAQGASSERRGIILSTHDPDQAFALSARVLLMHEGRIIADGPASEVLTARNLSTVYSIPVTIESTGSGRKVCLPSLHLQSDPTITSDALTIA